MTAALPVARSLPVHSPTTAPVTSPLGAPDQIVCGWAPDQKIDPVAPNGMAARSALASTGSRASVTSASDAVPTRPLIAVRHVASGSVCTSWKASSASDRSPDSGHRERRSPALTATLPDAWVAPLPNRRANGTSRRLPPNVTIRLLSSMSSVPKTIWPDADRLRCFSSQRAASEPRSTAVRSTPTRTPARSDTPVK